MLVGVTRGRLDRGAGSGVGSGADSDGFVSDSAPQIDTIVVKFIEGALKDKTFEFRADQAPIFIGRTEKC